MRPGRARGARLREPERPGARGAKRGRRGNGRTFGTRTTANPLPRPRSLPRRGGPRCAVCGAGGAVAGPRRPERAEPEGALDASRRAALHSRLVRTATCERAASDLASAAVCGACEDAAAA
eukprot:1976342-Prymnesium_polylepis.2